jgi:hypothetical protein
VLAIKEGSFRREKEIKLVEQEGMEDMEGFPKYLLAEWR